MIKIEKNEVVIAPSLLAANKAKLDDELKLAKNAGARFIHYDVMDGKFVPNTAYTLEEFKSIDLGTYGFIKDVHIMVSDPLSVGVSFASSGADIVTFHYEALNSDKERFEVIDAIKKAGAKAVGISIKPNTSVKVLDKYIDKVDLILIMSVEPGKGGQKFNDSALEKIAYLRDKIDKNNLNTVIEVDGGINEETAKLVRRSGANILVAGSYLFGHDDFILRYRSLLK